MNDAGLFEVFQEVNGVEPEQRKATFEYESKCTDFVLTTDGILLCVKGIELIECSEIVESYHPGHLTDVDLSDYFSEDFDYGDVTQKNIFEPK